MPRGMRKSPKEKLQEQLEETAAAIGQYEAAIAAMKEKKQELEDEIRLLEVKELADLMEENHLTTEMMKQVIEHYISEEQSA